MLLGSGLFLFLCVLCIWSSAIAAEGGDDTERKIKRIRHVPSKNGKRWMKLNPTMEKIGYTQGMLDGEIPHPDVVERIGSKIEANPELLADIYYSLDEGDRPKFLAQSGVKTIEELVLVSAKEEDKLQDILEERERVELSELMSSNPTSIVLELIINSDEFRPPLTMEIAVGNLDKLFHPFDLSDLDFTPLLKWFNIRTVNDMEEQKEGDINRLSMDIPSVKQFFDKDKFDREEKLEDAILRRAQVWRQSAREMDEERNIDPKVAMPDYKIEIINKEIFLRGTKTKGIVYAGLEGIFTTLMGELVRVGKLVRVKGLDPEGDL